MTNEELRELDAWIAEHVMGHPMPTVIGAWDIRDLQGKSFDLCPFYSTDIAAAWEVVEKIKTMRTKNGLCFKIEIFAGSYNGQRTSVTICGDREYHQDWIDTAPLAICLAAKKLYEQRSTNT